MIQNIKVGDVLSETSHYKITEVISSIRVSCIHIESGDRVSIGLEYLKNYCQSADDYSEVKEVTREDKLDGTPGIRSIFEGIHSS